MQHWCGPPGRLEQPGPPHSPQRASSVATSSGLSPHVLRLHYRLLARLGGAPPHEARHRDAAAEELPPPAERPRVARHRPHAF